MAAHALGVSLGCRILRAHDVRAARRVCDTLAAVMEATLMPPVAAPRRLSRRADRRRRPHPRRRGGQGGRRRAGRGRRPGPGRRGLRRRRGRPGRGGRQLRHPAVPVRRGGSWWCATSAGSPPKRWRRCWPTWRSPADAPCSSWWPVGVRSPPSWRPRSRPAGTCMSTKVAPEDSPRLGPGSGSGRRPVRLDGPAEAAHRGPPGRGRQPAGCAARGAGRRLRRGRRGSGRRKSSRTWGKPARSPRGTSPTPSTPGTRRTPSSSCTGCSAAASATRWWSWPSSTATCSRLLRVDSPAIQHRGARPPRPWGSPRAEAPIPAKKALAHGPALGIGRHRRGHRPGGRCRARPQGRQRLAARGRARGAGGPAVPPGPAAAGSSAAASPPPDAGAGSSRPRPGPAGRRPGRPSVSCMRAFWTGAAPVPGPIRLQRRVFPVNGGAGPSRPPASPPRR